MLDAWSGSKQSILLVKAPMTEASSNAYLDCAPHGILASSPLSLKRCPSQCTRHASNVRLLNHHWHRPSPSTHFNRSSVTRSPKQKQASSAPRSILRCYIPRGCTPSASKLEGIQAAFIQSCLWLITCTPSTIINTQNTKVKA